MRAIAQKEPFGGISMAALGMAAILVSIGSFFTALILAYYFGMHSRTAPQHLHVPLWFWVSTAVILASSISLQMARSELRRAHLDAYRAKLRFTIGLGLLFLGCQLLGWWNLERQGVYLAANPHGSVYFSFSGIHGVHLIGGIGALCWLLAKARAVADGEEQPLRKHRRAAQMTSYYWHFMGGLWVILFGFLLLWS